MDIDKIIKKYDQKGFEQPISKKSTLNWSSFAGSFAGENVAGTEFVIGAMFVSWGVSAESVIFGLLIGNLLAVLNWYLICAPISVETRVTLYGYLRKIAGPKMTSIYNILNAVLFCVLSGSMITVSASAIRVLFNIPAQINWYPTSLAFVFIVLIIGIIVALIATLGFEGISKFASVCSPWLMLMFIVGAITSMPVVLNSLGVIGIDSFSSFMDVANKGIWVKSPNGVGFLTVAAFSWICNLACNAGLSDMAVFRYAKNKNAGLASITGMLLGHYVAWIAAGILGAGAALVLNSHISTLDPGAVSFSALGVLGIIAVILAGWTTSNPSLYRAGLAFQSIFRKHSVKKVTFITGVLTSIIACFPFVFSQLLNFVGYMGVLLAPIGAIVITEHYIFPKIGYTRYWASYKNLSLNKSALITWITSVILAILLEQLNIIPLFFLFVPLYLFTIVMYILLAGKNGAKEDYSKDIQEESIYNTYIQKKIDSEIIIERVENNDVITKTYLIASVISLIIILYLAINVYNTPFDNYTKELNKFKQLTIIPTITYFISSIFYLKRKAKKIQDKDEVLVSEVI